MVIELPGKNREARGGGEGFLGILKNFSGSIFIGPA
jgi:hypothetical protein